MPVEYGLVWWEFLIRYANDGSVHDAVVGEEPGLQHAGRHLVHPEADQVRYLQIDKHKHSTVCNVLDTWLFGVDPDPRIYASD